MSDLTFWTNRHGDILVFHRFKSKTNAPDCGAYVVGKADTNGVVLEINRNGIFTAAVAWNLEMSGREEVAITSALRESLEKRERLRPPK